MKLRHLIKEIRQRDRSAWRYFASCFSGAYRTLAWSTVGSAAQTILIVPSLLLVKYAFDRVIPDQDIPLLIGIGLVIFLLRLASSATSVWIRNIHIRAINQVVRTIRKELVTRIYRMPYQMYTSTDLRIVHARMVQDSERLANMGTAIVSRIVPSVLIGSGLLLVCLFLNAYLLGIIVAMTPLLMLANRILGKKINRRVTVFQKAFEEFSKGTQLMLKFLPLTVMQSATDQEQERQQHIINTLETETGRMASIFAINHQIQETLTGLAAILIIVAGGISVATGAMSLGDFLSFYLAALYLNKSINTITTSLPEIIAGDISLTKIYALISGIPDSTDSPKTEIPFHGHIALTDVAFSYRDKPVLSGINLTLTPGEWISLSGPNGAGKTTLINIITGMLSPTSGLITASGIPYQDQNPDALRKRMGIVPQHPLLFPGTILENITFGERDVDAQKAIKVCKLSLVHDFITSLPEGYQTQVGDDGILISGGEGQRIAIARALYRNPALLILDEPINHLEQHHAEQILRNIKTMNPLPTVCIISHDDLTRAFAHRHYHLEGGVISETKDDATT